MSIIGIAYIWSLIYLLIRIYMAKSKHFKSDWNPIKEHPAVRFQFDMAHHLDIGFIITLLAIITGATYYPLGIVLYATGGFTMLDDVWGHLRAADGGPEEFILEPLFRPIINFLYKVFTK